MKNIIVALFFFVTPLSIFAQITLFKTRMSECTLVTKDSTNLVYKKGIVYDGTMWSKDGKSSIKCSNGMISSLNGYYSSGELAVKIELSGRDAMFIFYTKKGTIVMTKKYDGFLGGMKYLNRSVVYTLDGSKVVDKDSQQGKATNSYLESNGAYTSVANLLNAFAHELEWVK